MKRKIREYASEQVIVEYDVRRCIHAAECVKGLPPVFDPGRRPWIDPGQTNDIEELARVIERCPTGALQYRAAGDTPVEAPDATNTVRVRADGPLYIRGDLRLVLPDGETLEQTRVALCRCGQSKDKPFCDNSHQAIGFEHDGRLAEISLKSEAEPSRTIEVQPLPDGPILVSGATTVTGEDGASVQCTAAAFCRCGHSATKPFCDGTHRKMGFTSAG